MSGAWERAWREHPAALSAVAVLLVATASSLAGLSNGYALDDVPMIFNNTRIHSVSDWWGLVWSAYWQLPPRDTLWRPFALPAFAVQWAAGGGAPIVFHAVNITLYALVSLAVLAVARRVLSFWGALVAGLLFAAHPVHVEAVANVVGQLELWAALAVMGASALYVRARQRGHFGWGTIVGVLALFTLGLGMKEHTLVLPLLLLALELTVLRHAPALGAKDQQRRRIAVVVLVGIVTLWFAWRTELLGGFAGDHPHAAFRGLDTLGRAWVMLGLVPDIARLLFWPARLAVDYSPAMVPVLSAPGLAHLPGALLLLGGVGTAWWAWRSGHLALVLALLWIPLSLALVANVLVPTGVMIAERTLFLTSVGAALSVGAAVELLAPRWPSFSRGIRGLVVTGAVAMLVLAVARSHQRQAVWMDSDAVTESLLADAPANFRGHFWRGDEHFRAGRFVAGEQSMRRAMELWPEHDGAALGLALRYHEQQMCAPAIPLYRHVIALEPEKPAPYFGLAGCQLERGQLLAARRTATAGLATGLSGGTMRLMLGLIDSSLAATDTVLPNNRWVARQTR